MLTQQPVESPLVAPGDASEQLVGFRGVNSWIHVLPRRCLKGPRKSQPLSTERHRKTRIQQRAIASKSFAGIAFWSEVPFRKKFLGVFESKARAVCGVLYSRKSHADFSSCDAE